MCVGHNLEDVNNFVVVVVVNQLSPKHWHLRESLKIGAGQICSTKQLLRT